MRWSIRAVAVLAVIATAPALRVSAAGLHRSPDLANSVRIVRTEMPAGASSVNLDAGVWSVQGLTLRELLSEIYSIEPSRIDISAAAQLDDRFDVTLPLVGNESDAAIRTALQRALTEQLDVNLSFETRTVESYVLTASSEAAAKLRTTSASRRAESPGAITVAGQQCPGVLTGEIMAHGATIATLASALEDTLDGPVLDETGLSGLYDFHIPEYRSSEQLFQLLREHLGLSVTREPRQMKILTVRLTSVYQLRAGL